MSISAVITAMQAIHGAISGVTTAPTAVPGALNTADLPMVLMLPGSASWLNLTTDQTLGRQQRDYLVQVYVAPIAQGQGVDEGYQDVVTLLQSFGATYVADITGGGAFEQMRIIRDSGHQVLQYAGVDYHGFIYTLTIKEKPT